MSSAKTTRQSGVSTNAAVQPIPKKSLQIRTDKPRPHLCTICTRGFARLEHLKRHERAHTNEKPYQCAACGRCFARRDLVLRHQQKLHQNIFTVARRGSLPASLTEPDEVDVAHTSPNENVIILRNNTSAKAPLPDQPNMFKNSGLGSRGLESGGSDSASSSPSTASPRTVSAHQGPHNIDSIISTGQNYANKPIQVNGVIPSPDTTSHHNTPPVPGAMLKTGPSFSDLDMLSSHNNYLADYTQQPSPSMGDSPSDILEKQRLLKEKQRQDFLNDQLDFKSSLDLKSLNGFQSRPPNPRTRHSSFSAIPGLSYTNLQDALTIRNTQSGSKQNFNSHGIPQFNDADIGYVPYLFDTDVDWYNMNLENSTRVVPNGPTGELLPSKDAGSKPEKNEFKMNHPLIPTEPQFSGAFMENESPSHIITGHQFQNPEHPHHIRGTTPLDFEFSAYKEPLHHGELPEIQFGSGYAQLTQDIALLQEHEARKKLGSHENQVHESQVHAGPEIFARREAATSNTPPKTNESMLQDPKRRKIGFVNDIDDLTWLEEFKDIPVPNELPIASKDTGFVGMPFVKDEFKSDEVFSLFKLKQDDLVKQRSQLDLNSLKRTHMAQSNSSGAASRPGHAWSKTSRAHFTIGEPNDFITDELRARVIETSHVVEEHFPSKEDLNEYMDLYGEEFNTYFSFIHLETLKDPMVDNFENIPMILAMCAIGALYSYHDSNTLLLFNLSKYHIHKFFENEVTPNKLQSKKVPIMAHQCLVLHIFISMFLNEPNMVEITSKQVYSMVGLIRSTNFFRPLEQFLLPPPPVTNPNDQENLQNNYGYFIMAQTRIRTLLTFYQLEVIRSILIGGPLPMTGAELKSGIHCKDESLWQAGNSGEWFARVSKHKDWCIVDLSNNKSLQELAETLKGAQMTDEKSSFDKSMALLMYVHEQISDSYISGFDAFTWRSECRPKLKYLILSWEEYFVRNGGSVIINNQNQTMLTKNTELKVILPLLWLAKIRLCVNFVPVTFALLSRDWLGMSESLVKLEDDVDGLRDASIHALDILKLWIHNTSVVNDAKQTSVRTPVFFLTAVFISVMVLGKTIDVIENGKSLSVSEKALWQSCEKVFRSIETTLSAHEQSSYSEFLNKQSGGVFNFAQSNAFHNNVAALNLGDPAIKVRQLKKCKLSTRVLALGVRILADAPLWPLAMRFAEAFKHMAVEIENRG